MLSRMEDLIEQSIRTGIASLSQNLIEQKRHIVFVEERISAQTTTLNERVSPSAVLYTGRRK